LATGLELTTAMLPVRRSREAAVAKEKEEERSPHLTEEMFAAVHRLWVKVKFEFRFRAWGGEGKKNPPHPPCPRGGRKVDRLFGSVPGRKTPPRKEGDAFFVCRQEKKQRLSIPHGRRKKVANRRDNEYEGVIAPSEACKFLLSLAIPISDREKKTDVDPGG